MWMSTGRSEFMMYKWTGAHLFVLIASELTEKSLETADRFENERKTGVF